MAHGAAQNGRDTGKLIGTILAAVATAAEQHMNDFNLQNIANTAWAFATAGQNDASLFAALATAAKPRMGELKLQVLANTAWAFATAD